VLYPVIERRANISKQFFLSRYAESIGFRKQVLARNFVELPVDAHQMLGRPFTFWIDVVNGDNTVSEFSITPATGALTSIGTLPAIANATSLYALAVDPAGQYLYAVDQGNGTSPGQVFGFNIGSGGVIGAAIPGPPVATGINPATAKIDSTGLLLAIPNSGNNGANSSMVSLYTIGSGGTLTSGSSIAVGSIPTDMAFSAGTH
jgi:hypothetical protein